MVVVLGTQRKFTENMVKRLRIKNLGGRVGEKVKIEIVLASQSIHHANMDHVIPYSTQRPKAKGEYFMHLTIECR